MAQGCARPIGDRHPLEEQGKEKTVSVTQACRSYHNFRRFLRVPMMLLIGNDPWGEKLVAETDAPPEVNETDCLR
jgi:hypothetical protein